MSYLLDFYGLAAIENIHQSKVMSSHISVLCFSIHLGITIFFSQKADLILEDMIHPQTTNDYSFEDDNDSNQSLPDSVTETTTVHFKLHKYRI